MVTMLLSVWVCEITRPWRALRASMEVADLKGDRRYVDRRDLTQLEGFRRKYGTKEGFLRLTPVLAAEIFQEMVLSPGSCPFPTSKKACPGREPVPAMGHALQCECINCFSKR